MDWTKGPLGNILVCLHKKLINEEQHLFILLLTLTAFIQAGAV